MFDVGFWELVLVGVVSLLAFGPERLPKVARETALWIRKVRQVATSAKREINQELQLLELQESLKKQRKALQSGRFDLEGPGAPPAASGDQSQAIKEDRADGAT